MNLFFLTYVSVSRLQPDDAAREVDDIVRFSQMWNAAQGITGALLFTGARFAQALEGERAVVESLMTSIRRDPRHEKVLVVDQKIVPARRFADWTMAYRGPAHFVERHVEQLFGPLPPAEQKAAVERLTHLLVEFSRE